MFHVTLHVSNQQELEVPSKPTPCSPRQRVQKHRDNMREAGFRPVQIWVPDTRREGFAEECIKQSHSLKSDPEEKEVMDWIEDSYDDEGWS